jgi:hypothetical protein
MSTQPDWIGLHPDVAKMVVAWAMRGFQLQTVDGLEQLLVAGAGLTELTWIDGPCAFVAMPIPYYRDNPGHFRLHWCKPVKGSLHLTKQAVDKALAVASRFVRLRHDAVLEEAGELFFYYSAPAPNGDRQLSIFLSHMGRSMTDWVERARRDSQRT